MSIFRRLLLHVFAGRFVQARRFPPAVLQRIAAAIEGGERNHAGEIVFAVKARWSLADVVAGHSVRARAEQAFATLRVWDTQDNCGVLVYALIAERKIELVADRGISARVPQEKWQTIVDDLARAFAGDDPAAGVLVAVNAIGALLAHHYPVQRGDRNELPDHPVVL